MPTKTKVALPCHSGRVPQVELHGVHLQLSRLRQADGKCLSSTPQRRSRLLATGSPVRIERPQTETRQLSCQDLGYLLLDPRQIRTRTVSQDRHADSNCGSL